MKSTRQCCTLSNISFQLNLCKLLPEERIKDDAKDALSCKFQILTFGGILALWPGYYGQFFFCCTLCFSAFEAIFCPKQPQKAFKIAKRSQTAATLHVRLDFPVSESPLVRSNSAICPRNGPKRRQNPPQICAMCSNSPKPRTGRILGYVAQNPIPRGPSPPATPHFLWFPPLEIAQTNT